MSCWLPVWQHVNPHSQATYMRSWRHTKLTHLQVWYKLSRQGRVTWHTKKTRAQVQVKTTKKCSKRVRLQLLPLLTAASQNSLWRHSHTPLWEREKDIKWETARHRKRTGTTGEDVDTKRSFGCSIMALQLSSISPSLCLFLHCPPEVCTFFHMCRISFFYTSTLTFCCNLFFSSFHSLLLLCTPVLDAVCIKRTCLTAQPFILLHPLLSFPFSLFLPLRCR